MLTYLKSLLRRLRPSLCVLGWALTANPASAADAAKISVVVPMVRIEVATPNPAVNQTYELEIDSFDGQSLRGFEPQQAVGTVRSLISINMASVRTLAFFQRTIERAAPVPDRTPSGLGRDPDPTDRGTLPPGREPNKDLQRRFDHLVRDGGEAQLMRIFETLKSPQELRQLRGHLQERMESAATLEERQAAVRTLFLAEYLYNCTEAARNFEHTTSTQYFAQIPQFLRDAQLETAQAIRRLKDEAARNEADKVLNAQDVKMFSKPLAERVWNQTVPPDRAIQPSPTRRFGNGPKPFKNPRPVRPADEK